MSDHDTQTQTATSMPEQAKGWRPLMQRYFPGVAVALIIGLAANFLSDHYGAPTMLFALLLGLALNFLASDGKIRPGLDFAAKSLLRLGIALLGLRIAISDITGLGWEPLALIVGATVSTIGVGILGARLLGKSYSFGVLTGGAVAICGASAAMAICAILPDHARRDRDTAFTVVGVTTLSTLAMILYPILAASMALDDWTAGLFLGATIHDVAQVVGAGFSISDEAGNIATVAKLMRVAMLVPIVLLLALFFRAGEAGPGAERPPLLPLFLVVFVLLVLVNSSGVLPAAVTGGLSDFSRLCLTTAIAAVGVKTQPREIMAVGWKPALLMLVETLWIAGLVLLVVA